MSAPVRIDLAFTLEQDGFVLEIDHHADSRVLALFGPSGSGKTTSLEVIAGLRAPVARPDRDRRTRAVFLGGAAQPAAAAAGRGVRPAGCAAVPTPRCARATCCSAPRTRARAHGHPLRAGGRARDRGGGVAARAARVGALGRGAAAGRARTRADVVAGRPAARRAAGGRRSSAAPAHRRVPPAHSRRSRCAGDLRHARSRGAEERRRYGDRARRGQGRQRRGRPRAWGEDRAPGRRDPGTPAVFSTVRRSAFRSSAAPTARARVRNRSRCARPPSAPRLWARPPGAGSSRARGAPRRARSPIASRW